MDQDDKTRTRAAAPAPAPAAPADKRRERLAAALRDNLKRRKSQGKARRADNPPNSGQG